MAAEAHQKVTARVERLHKVEALDAASRAFPYVVRVRPVGEDRLLKRDKDGRQAVALGHARGDDAHDALQPSIVLQHEDAGRCFAILLGLGQSILDHGVGLLGNVILLGLTAGVDAAQRLSQLGGLLGSLRQQKVDRLHGVGNAPGGVNTRGDAEAHKAGIHAAAGLFGGLRIDRDGRTSVAGIGHGIHEGAEPGARGVLQHGKAARDDETVFSDKRHDIRNGADGHKIDILCRHGLKGRIKGHPCTARLAGAKKFKHNTHAGQFLKRVEAIRAMGINDGTAGGQFPVTLMVVGHDRVNTESARISNLVHGGDAGVHGDDEIGTVLRQLVHGRAGHTISLADAVGNITGYIRADRGKIEVERGDGGHAVHVVISVDDNIFPCRHGAQHAGDGRLHILHGERVAENATVTVQKQLSLRRVAIASIIQKTCHQRGDPQRGRKGVDRLVPLGIPRLVAECPDLLPRGGRLVFCLIQGGSPFCVVYDISQG